MAEKLECTDVQYELNTADVTYVSQKSRIFYVYVYLGTILQNICIQAQYYKVLASSFRGQGERVEIYLGKFEIKTIFKH